MSVPTAENGYRGARYLRDTPYATVTEWRRAQIDAIPDDEKCRHCKGSGADVILASNGGVGEVTSCWLCGGSGRQPVFSDASAGGEAVSDPRALSRLWALILAGAIALIAAPIATADPLTPDQRRALHPNERTAAREVTRQLRVYERHDWNWENVSPRHYRRYAAARDVLTGANYLIHYPPRKWGLELWRTPRARQFRRHTALHCALRDTLTETAWGDIDD